jgi:hypothetical protein
MSVILLSEIFNRIRTSAGRIPALLDNHAPGDVGSSGERWKSKLYY